MLSPYFVNMASSYRIVQLVSDLQGQHICRWALCCLTLWLLGIFEVFQRFFGPKRSASPSKAIFGVLIDAVTVLCRWGMTFTGKVSMSRMRWFILHSGRHFPSVFLEILYFESHFVHLWSAWGHHEAQGWLKSAFSRRTEIVQGIFESKFVHHVVSYKWEFLKRSSRELQKWTSLWTYSDHLWDIWFVENAVKLKFGL